MHLRRPIAALLLAVPLAAACSSDDDSASPDDDDGAPADALTEVEAFLASQSTASWVIDTESQAVWNSLVDEQEGFRIVVPGTRHEVIRAEVRADLATATGSGASEWLETTWEGEPLPRIPFVDAFVSEDSLLTRAACSAADLEAAAWASSPLTDADADGERESPQFSSPNWLAAIVALLDEPSVTQDGDDIVLEETFTVADGERVGPWPLYGLRRGTDVVVEVTAGDDGEILGVEVSTPGDGSSVDAPFERVTLSELAWGVDVPEPPASTVDMASYVPPDCPGEPPSMAIPL